MTWNYRLFRQHTPESAEGKYLFFVGECYYDDNNSPEMHSTMEHNHICGDDETGTKETYVLIGEAFDKPVIELDAEGKFEKVQEA